MLTEDADYFRYDYRVRRSPRPFVSRPTDDDALDANSDVRVGFASRTFSQGARPQLVFLVCFRFDESSKK